MPLRSFARKLGAPAIPALRRASSPRVSPAAGSGLRPFRSSKGGERSREAYQATLKDMEKWNKERASKYLEVSRFVDNLPRTIALSAAAGILAGTSVVAYAVGAYE